ncbi:MAG: twin-arginine translocase TatA/TatE family subunit [Candidatus Nanopelagicales bacterium]
MGFGEILVLAVLGLLVLGPDKLPEYIRGGVKLFNQFRTTATKARNEIVESAGLKDLGSDITQLNPKKIVSDVLKEKPTDSKDGKNYSSDIT